MTPSPSPSPRHSSVRPSQLPLQNVSPRPPELHRLVPNRLHSRQASNNSNQQSSLDDSGVVDDHDGDDVTSAEEHDKRESREHRTERQEKSPREQGKVGQSTPSCSNCPPAPVAVSVRSGNREIRVLKYNGVKTKKHMYALPPEYLSHIVVLGERKPLGVLPYWPYTLFIETILLVVTVNSSPSEFFSDLSSRASRGNLFTPQQNRAAYVYSRSASQYFSIKLIQHS